MTAEIGQYALILALMVSAVGGVLTLAGAELASRSWMRVGMAAAAVLAVLATIAIGALAWGFVESDFSILNVARNSNIALPWYYKLAAVWGSHEGSILFWVTTLAWWILLLRFQPVICLNACLRAFSARSSSSPSGCTFYPHYFESVPAALSAGRGRCGP